MQPEVLCISVLRGSLGPRVMLAGCKNALTPTIVYFTDRSKTMVPVLVLLFVALFTYSIMRFVLSLAVCYFVLVFFSPFCVATISLGEEIATLSAFRTFVRFALVWFCLIPLPLCARDVLRLVIVALPGHSSYIFTRVIPRLRIKPENFYIKRYYIVMLAQ